MKSKEAIRNKILAYTNLVWGTRKIDRLDILVRMMVEELTNELYLLQNKMNDIDTVLLEKIAKKLTPQKYISIRPSHTILQITPNVPYLTVDKDIPFFLNDIPIEIIKENADAIPFYPVAETQLLNVKLNYLFHHKQLFHIDNAGRKQLITSTKEQSAYNSIWLGLNIDEQVQDIKNLSFYIDFPRLSEIHDYYEVLPYTRCLINGENVRLKPQFPYYNTDQELAETDYNIMQMYEDHYLTIDESVNLQNIKPEKLPSDLQAIIDMEAIGDMKPTYWIQLLFRPNFTVEDLEHIIIAINTFPVSNKKYRRITITKENLEKATSLPSDVGEKLLSVDSVTDSRHNSYLPDTLTGTNDAGTYHQETVNDIFLEDRNLTDHIEELLDLIDEERVAFPTIDKDKVGRIMTSITNSDEGNVKKVHKNNKIDNPEIGRISITPHENINSASIAYWVTYGELTNGISSGEMFFPNKTSPLDGIVAMSLCEVHGAKEFSDIRDMMSINKYILTSKDRIITEHNIISFCESELGRAIEKVEIELGGRISPKPKEGLIRVINLNITPSQEYPELIQHKGILKDLKVRLQQRSPDNYNYVINIVQPII